MLFDAIDALSLEDVKFFLKHGANKNAKNDQQQTVLQFCAIKGYTAEIIDHLVSLKVDVNTVHPHSHETALNMASRLKHNEVADHIKKAGGKYAHELTTTIEKFKA